MLVGPFVQPTVEQYARNMARKLRSTTIELKPGLIRVRVQPVEPKQSHEMA